MPERVDAENGASALFFLPRMGKRYEIYDYMIKEYIKENHYPLSCRWKKVIYNIFQMA